MTNLEQGKDFYTVGEIAGIISAVFQNNFTGRVKIKGEISARSPASPNAHWYFTIKDSSATLNGVCWRSQIRNLKFVPKHGEEVFCYGRLKTYPAGSNYQLDVDRFEPLGVGDLARKLLELKEKFKNEGLFDPEHKKSLPFMPQTIGVITSETGAVIHDIIKTVESRFPSHILLYPVPVQGAGSGEKIAQAIAKMNELPVDVIIVARGGGSLEDLWEFNSEVVVRAVYNSKKPIVSGVGHETDTTLIDLVADEPALTPTKAGVRVVPDKAALKTELNDKTIRLEKAVKSIIGNCELRLKAMKMPDLNYALNIKEQQLDQMKMRLQAAAEKQLQTAVHRFEMIGDRIPLAMRNIANAAEKRLQTAAQLLESYSYKAVLNRGFAMITDADGKTVTSTTNLKRNQNIVLSLRDGKAVAVISSVNPD